jgi:hypothetical protein
VQDHGVDAHRLLHLLQAFDHRLCCESLEVHMHFTLPSTHDARCDEKPLFEPK